VRPCLDSGRGDISGALSAAAELRPGRVCLKSGEFAGNWLNSKKAALLVVGIILLLMGVVFALQGDNVIRGSSLMSGNSEYIYIGGAVAIIGLILIALSTRVGRRTPSSQAAAPASP
jgi:hypothetical protein